MASFLSSNRNISEMSVADLINSKQLNDDLNEGLNRLLQVHSSTLQPSSGSCDTDGVRLSGRRHISAAFAGGCE
jgi:hypothetical protein